MNIFRNIEILLFVLMILAGGDLLKAQIPPVEEDDRGDIEDATQWLEIESYHVAKQELEKVLSRATATQRERDVLFLLLKTAYNDHDFEESLQWSAEFLSEYPVDGDRVTVLFVKAMSAYQIDHLKEAKDAFTLFLNEAPNDPQRGSALFWRAMCSMELGDWASVESDIQQCYDDPATDQFKDNALMGWALSLERRGEYARATEYLVRLIKEYPSSELVNAARLRLASLALRQNNPVQSLTYLGETYPETPAQQEEFLLLRAEAKFRSAKYAEAQSDYEKLFNDTPDRMYQKTAQYGIAWSKLKRGDISGARKEFDTLSTQGRDQLAYAALFQSGVLALLDHNSLEAMAKFDTLTVSSPYDQFAEQAYYQMGLIQYRAKRYKEARRNFQLAARLFPESSNRAQAYRMSGEASIALRDFSNAQHSFAQVRRVGGSQGLLSASLLQEGISLYHLGRFRTSAETFAGFVQKYPQDKNIAEAHLWRAEALYQDGKYGDAERSYADALKLLPKGIRRASASYGAAWTMFEQKKFSQAADAFDRFTSEYPNDEHVLDASLRKADCYFFLGQYDKSTALYEALAAEKGGSRHAEYAAFQLAMSYVQRGESERGITHLRNFLTRFPSSLYNEVVQFNIGWTYFSKDQFNEAMTEFRTVLREYPESQLMPRVLFNMGDVFYNLKQYDSSRVYYQRVVKEYPTSPLVPDAMTGLQYSYEAEGKPAGALAEIDTLLRSAPPGSSQEELVMRKGDILFGQADFAGAVIEYQKLLAMKPSKPFEAKALFQLGRSYELENNPQQAAQYYERIRREFYDTETAPAVFLALGIAQIKSKQYKPAVSVLEEFETRYPESPLLSEVRYNKGLALSNLPDKNAAVAQFQSVIQNHKDDIFADRSRLQIARLYIGKKDFKPALDTLNNLVSRRNDDLAAEGLLIMGECYLSTKKTADALQAFKDVYEQYSEFPLLVERARLGAGECYERLKDIKQARAAYEAVVTSAVDPVIKKDAQQRLKRLR